jgi:Flp pilus assembly protein TadD
MDEHRDIYTKPGPKDDKAPDLPAYEATPDQIRQRSRRRTTLSTGIMVGLLVGAAIYFYVQEVRHRRDPLGDLLRGPGEVTNQALRTSVVTPLGIPDLSQLADDLEAAGRSAPPGIPPQKMAEAMGEMRIANQYLLTRDWESAEKHVKLALQIWPDMNTGLRLLGVIYTQRGQFEQAILTLERALKSDPFSAETFNNLATAYLQKNQLEKAEDLLLTALQIRPNGVISHTNLGLLYLLWGRYEQSAEHLQAAVQQMPDNPSIRNNLGVALLRIGRYDEARAHFQFLIERMPTRPEAYFNTAITFALERNPEEAMNWIRQAAARCSPVEAQRHLMDSDFNALRGLPDFQVLMRELSEPRVVQPLAPTS